MDVSGRIEPLLHLSDAPLRVTSELAGGLLAVFAVTACIWSNFPLILLGKSGDAVHWLLRLVICVALLGSFDEILFFSVRAGAAIAQQIEESSDAHHDPAELLLGRHADETSPTAGTRHPQKGAWALAGFSWASPAAWVATSTRFIIFLASELLVVGAALGLTLLRVLGPLMIAAGIFAKSTTIPVLFRNLLWISSWPIIPACTSLILHHEFSQQEAGNGAFLLVQGLIFALGTLFTPHLSNFLLASSGLDRVAAWGSQLAFGAASQGIQATGGSAVRAMSSALGSMPSGGSSGIADDMARSNPSARPGDAASSYAAQQGLEDPIGGRDVA